MTKSIKNGSKVRIGLDMFDKLDQNLERGVEMRSIFWFSMARPQPLGSE